MQPLFLFKLVLCFGIRRLLETQIIASLEKRKDYMCNNRSIREN